MALDGVQPLRFLCAPGVGIGGRRAGASAADRLTAIAVEGKKRVSTRCLVKHVTLRGSKGCALPQDKD